MKYTSRRLLPEYSATRAATIAAISRTRMSGFFKVLGSSLFTTSAYVSKGSLAWALAYPIALPLLMFLIALFVMPETRRMKVWAADP